MEKTVALQLEEAEKFLADEDIGNAISICKEITEKNNGVDKAWKILSHCAKKQGELDKALEFIKKASLDAPGEPDYYFEIGNLLANKQEIESAKNNYLQALKLEPDHAPSLLELGVIELHSGALQESFEYLLQYIKLKPDDSIAYNNIGCIMAMSGNLDKAIEYFEKTIELNPEQVDAISNLANIYTEKGKLEKATQLYNKALEINPNHADAHNNLANLYKKNNEFDKAKHHYNQSIELNKNHAEAMCNLGDLAIQTGDLVAANMNLTRSLELAPNMFEAHFNFGILNLKQDEIDAAFKNFSNAIQLNPANAKSYYYLGHICEYRGKYSDAIEYHLKSVEIDNNNIDSLKNLAVIYKANNELEKSKKFFQRILELDSNNCYALCSIIYIKLKQIDHDNIKELISKLEIQIEDKLKKNEVINLSAFEFASFTTNYELITEVFKQQSNYFSNCYAEYKFKTYTNNKNKIKIGYLSCDLNQHAVGLLLRDIFKYHDREQFDIYIYDYGINNSNANTGEIQSSCDNYTNVFDKTPLQIAKQINQDGIDILVDLVGYTSNYRTGILAMQPAPIQCHWMGSSYSMQANFIQYYIANENLIPKEIRSSFSEKILSISPTAHATKKFDDINESSKENYGLPGDKFIFACFAQNYRLTPTLLQSWRNILKKCENSVLWLNVDNEQAEQNIIKYFNSNNLEPSRLILSRNITVSKDWPNKLADLYLDTFNLTGGTSTILNLWASLPVITIEGEQPHNRMASYLLKSCNLDSLVAKNIQDYESLAYDLYSNKDKLTELKNRITKEKLQYPIFKPTEFIQNLESGYKKAIQLYKENKSYKDINI